jgi:choline dehydrogenase-like flavoprotein
VLIDGRTLPRTHTLETDVCIVGAGAAGITLAMELAGQPFRVLLVESGGLEFEGDTQSLYRGRSVGLRYFPLETSRLRYFGGTTNHWGGMCRPFAEGDFVRRGWIPYSGWPFTKAAVDPFYSRATRLLHLDRNEWVADTWTEADQPPLPLAGSRMVTRVHQRAWHQDERLRLGQTYRDTVIQAANVTTCLHGNALRIDTNETGKTIGRLHFATLAGNRFSVTAKLFILATGGVENARLLLLSNHRNPAGVGNPHDVVGRFFLEHPQLLAAIFRPSTPGHPLGFYRPHRVRGSLVSGSPEVVEEVRRSEGLVSVWLDFHTVHDERRIMASRRLASRRYLITRLRDRDIPDDFGTHLGNIAADLGDRALGTYGAAPSYADDPLDHVRLMAVVDPAPNPSSRITLGDELDQLGQRRVVLDWRLSPIDKHSVRRTVEIFGMELGRTGLGRLQMKVEGGESAWPDDLVGSGHHIGTTRMSDDPKLGVVDSNCRVHGISNLFISGSSVFPTAGSGTPTLLIVALALRLADHLKRILK